MPGDDQIQSKNPAQPPGNGVWGRLLSRPIPLVTICIAVSILLLLFLHQRLRCLFHFNPFPLAMTLIPIIAAGVVQLVKTIPKNIRKVLGIIVGSLCIPVLIWMIFTVIFQQPPTAIECAYDSGNAQKLIDLIEAEARDVLDEDLKNILKIYDPHAKIENKATGQKWQSPETYYVEKFNNEMHCQIEHYEYRIESLTTNTATISTGSRGEWGWESDGGCTMTYDNPPGSDRWSFRKDTLGRWRIIEFIYNAP